jgi:hypothetical protein
MGKFLYKMEVRHGLYEQIYFQQLLAVNERDAILQIVSSCKNYSIEKTLRFLDTMLGERWNAETFWRNADTSFLPDDESIAHTLLWIKGVDFDLESV